MKENIEMIRAEAGSAGKNGKTMEKMPGNAGMIRAEGDSGNGMPELEPSRRRTITDALRWMSTMWKDGGREYTEELAEDMIYAAEEVRRAVKAIQLDRRRKRK